MTVTFQISDKRGDAILLVKAEGPGDQVDAIHGGFVTAAAAVGLQASVDAFDSLPGAVATVQAAFPNAMTTIRPGPTSAPVYGEAPASWGQPPVPPFQPPAQPQAPAPQRSGQTKVSGGHCIHGPATPRQSKPDAPKQWRGYFCPQPKGAPDQCEPEFIR